MFTGGVQVTLASGTQGVKTTTQAYVLADEELFPASAFRCRLESMHHVCKIKAR